MGLLEKLWDETVAGPIPDAGLGRLRRTTTTTVRSPSEPPKPIGIPITRSITIIRRGGCASCISGEIGSGPTPASPVAPESPLTPATPRRGRRTPAAVAAEPRTPNAYDWLVISALDR
ncbi:hypothetical protein QJS04_geneDACA004855 [Acorus gramineus]|uniref:Uncharacterized protein n=1 Tax=Acorus gramineus TaxID=55184 RepID=A0AAV9BRS4_ACOGR|nr:hypothetical protein QJS04_geneDACA004855 [Acorus gramineus]